MRPLLLLATALTCATLATAQTGTFVTYGNGCSGGAGNVCLSANTQPPFAGNRGVGGNFALPVNTGATVRVICGFELYCKLASAASANMRVWIYDAAASGGPGKILRSGTMAVTNTLKWNTTAFAPLILLPNTRFFLVFDNRVNLNLPIMTTGTRNVHYFNGPPTWNGPFTSVRWNYKVVCCGGSTPTISNTGVPTINNSFTVDLAAAANNAQSYLSVGLGRTNIDLSIIGAPGCALYTNPLLLFGMRTSATGTARMRLAIPNNSSLVNAVFQTQWGVVTPAANPAGILFTAGGEGKVGR
jgi:hypothetical protein